MKQWNLEGQRVSAVYLGNIPVTGLITESRVTYGGGVKHSIQLDQPIEIFGTNRYQVLVREEEITSF